MLEEAIAHYHALLDSDTARATQQQLNDEQHARNLFFGERPLVSVLRPRMITAAQYQLLQRACGLVAGSYGGPQWPYLFSNGTKPSRRSRKAMTDIFAAS